MKKNTQRAVAGLFFALTALLYFNGCSVTATEEMKPSEVQGQLNVKVSPSQRQDYTQALAQGAQGDVAARAWYFLGLADYQDGNYPQAGQDFLKVDTGHAHSVWDRPAVFMMAAVLEKMHDAPRAIVQYQRLIQEGTPTQPESGLSLQARAALQRLIESPLTALQVDQLINYPVLPEFLPSLYLQRIQWLVREASALGVSGTPKVDAAFRAIDDFDRRYPESPEKKEVDRLAEEADEAVPVDKKALGLMLPMQGAETAIGQQLLQGAQLAVEEANASLAPGDKLTLVVQDEGQDNATAVAAATKLIVGSQVIGVIGPMASDACAAVLPLATAHRTPLLSPYAMRRDLSSASPYFFRNAMTLKAEAVAMADHAVLGLKVTRVAELYPDTPYGRDLAAAFAQRITDLGGNVALSISYTAGSSDFKDIAVRLGGVDPGIMKDADSDEKRDEESKVEQASTVLGRALLAIQAQVQAGTYAAQTGNTEDAYRPLTFPARVAVFDFASSTSAAVYNSGRSFSVRFARVLSQLDALTILGPDEGLKSLAARGLSPDAMTLPLAAELGRSMDADFALMGAVTELTPDWNYLSQTAKEDSREGRQARADIALFTSDQVFKVEAQMVDVRSASVVAHAQFEFYKMRPPLPNTLGLQALYLPGKAAEAVQTASAISFCNLKLALLGADLWNEPELLQNDNAGTLEGALISVGFFAESTRPAVRQFVAAYEKRYAEVPGQLAAQAYDAASIMVNLLRSGVSTREALRQALLSLHNFPGVTGVTSFDGQQDAIKQIPILRVNSVSQNFDQVQ